MITLNPVTSPTSSFGVTLEYENPGNGMKMGFFLVVIKDQTTQKFVDLINFCIFYLKIAWGAGSNFDNFDNSVRT